MKKIIELIQKYYDVLAYLFFGVLTTVVNYIVYLPCYNTFHFSDGRFAALERKCYEADYQCTGCDFELYYQ